MLADEPGLAAAVQLPRAAGALARLAVQPANARVSADGAVLLRVVATDAAGNPVEAAPKVEAPLGELSKLVLVAPGTWEARLAVPPRIGAIRRLQLVARAGGVEGRTELEVAAGPPAEMEVSAESAALVADGGAEARVRVRLRDRFGNPAEGPAPEVVATRRADIAAEPDGPGAWMIRYRPRRAREDGAEVLSVRTGGLEGAARLAIVAPERRLGLAPKLGLAASSGGLHAPYGAVEATYRSTLFAGRLALALELGGFVHESDRRGTGGRRRGRNPRARPVPAGALHRALGGAGRGAAGALGRRRRRARARSVGGIDRRRTARGGAGSRSRGPRRRGVGAADPPRRSARRGARRAARRSAVRGVPRIADRLPHGDRVPV